jgi:hypothetical protein
VFYDLNVLFEKFVTQERQSKQTEYPVTTSTTEARAAKGQYISRLLQELTVQLDQYRIEIQCDNPSV